MVDVANKLGSSFASPLQPLTVYGVQNFGDLSLREMFGEQICAVVCVLNLHDIKLTILHALLDP